MPAGVSQGAAHSHRRTRVSTMRRKRAWAIACADLSRTADRAESEAGPKPAILESQSLDPRKGGGARPTSRFTVCAIRLKARRLSARSGPFLSDMPGPPVRAPAPRTTPQDRDGTVWAMATRLGRSPFPLPFSADGRLQRTACEVALRRGRGRDRQGTPIRPRDSPWLPSTGSRSARSDGATSAARSEPLRRSRS